MLLRCGQDVADRLSCGVESIGTTWPATETAYSMRGVNTTMCGIPGVLSRVTEASRNTQSAGNAVSCRADSRIAVRTWPQWWYDSDSTEAEGSPLFSVPVLRTLLSMWAEVLTSNRDTAQSIVRSYGRTSRSTSRQGACSAGAY